MILPNLHRDIKSSHFVQRISEHHVAERATRGRPSDTLQLVVMPVLVVFVGFLTGVKLLTQYYKAPDRVAERTAEENIRRKVPGQRDS